VNLRNAIVIILTAIIIGGFFFAYKIFYSGTFLNQEAEKIYKIGFLLIDKDVQSDNIRGFKDAMKEFGYEDGKNVVYIEKNTGANRKLLPQYAKELDESGLDLIVVGASSAAEAFKNMDGLKTRVFFLAAGRPRSLVQNLQAPEGLITGIGEGTIEFEGKRLELLKKTAPSTKKVMAIVESNHPNAPVFKEKVEGAAKALGLRMVYIEIEKTDDLPKKLYMVNRANGDAFIGGPWPSNQKYAKEMADHFLKNKIPSINDETSVGANIGFLLTYSDDRYKTGKQAAESIVKILKGAPISDVPVEFAKDIVLEINQKTAEAIGIKIPKDILLNASKIYAE